MKILNTLQLKPKPFDGEVALSTQVAGTHWRDVGGRVWGNGEEACVSKGGRETLETCQGGTG